MSFTRSLLSLAKAFGLGALLAGVPAFATPTFDFSSGGSTSSWNGGIYTLGYTFSVTAPFSFNALGIYDLGSDGLGGAHAVGVWNSSGALVASTTVSGSGTFSDLSASGNGSWVYQSLGSTISLANGSYTIGAYYAATSTDSVEYYQTTSGLIQNVAGVTYTGYAFSDHGLSGLSNPLNQGNFGTSSPFYFGPNMATVPTNGVPDSGATALLFGGSLLGLAALRRRFGRA